MYVYVCKYMYICIYIYIIPFNPCIIPTFDRGLKSNRDVRGFHLPVGGLDLRKGDIRQLAQDLVPRMADGGDVGKIPQPWSNGAQKWMVCEGKWMVYNRKLG